VSRLERQDFLISATVHPFVPARVRHLARVPELKSATRASKQLMFSIPLDGCSMHALAACRARTSTVRRRFGNGTFSRAENGPRLSLALYRHLSVQLLVVDTSFAFRIFSEEAIHSLRFL
jgi:hypothetical protein